MTASQKKPKNEPRNFEAALRELEEITARLEQGDAPLDEAAAIYERGAMLIAYCRERLQDARGKIQKLENDSLAELDDVGE